ncbi:MAG: nucleotide exchange factor GrpE [Gammaproteobacteria bacterium]|nr:nucleotide exchange factor GrpE [Gammaproteobacteria bacterium]
MSTPEQPETQNGGNAPESMAETIVGEASAEIEALRQELAAAEAKREEHFQLALRTQAEMENVRRRAERDVQMARAYALEKFVDELIPVLDSLEHAMKAADAGTDVKAIGEGVHLTERMFVAALEKFGVVRLDPRGESFNPEHHEAMAMVPHPAAEPDTVLDVFQKGYQLNGRLVRPARVVVVKGE